MIYEKINQLIDEFPQIRAIGFGIPGAVNQGIINFSEIQELIQVPLEEVIRVKHEVEVVMENDMNLTAYGFYQKQEYDEDDSVTEVNFLEGAFPGAGVMVDGHILRGSTHFAGEIAFLPLGVSQDDLYRKLHDRVTFHLIAGQGWF